MKCILCGGYIPDGERVVVKRYNGLPSYYTRREVCEKCANTEGCRPKKKKSPINEIFCKRFAMLREQSGKSQGELVPILCASQASIQKYESGIRQPSADFIVNAATYFGVTTDYLLGMPGTDDEPHTKEEKP